MWVMNLQELPGSEALESRRRGQAPALSSEFLCGKRRRLQRATRTPNAASLTSWGQLLNCKLSFAPSGFVPALTGLSYCSWASLSLKIPFTKGALLYLKIWDLRVTNTVPPPHRNYSPSKRRPKLGVTAVGH